MSSSAGYSTGSTTHMGSSKTGLQIRSSSSTTRSSRTAISKLPSRNKPRMTGQVKFIFTYLMIVGGVSRLIASLAKKG